MSKSYDLFSLAGKRALITGSGQGIGFQIARGLAAVDLLDMIQAGHLPAWLARGTREKHGLIDRYRVKRTDLEALAGVRVEKANSAGAA